jgi:hypothetical protein
MRSSPLLAAALASAVLSGCVLTTSTVPATATPGAGSGYVAGLFARTDGHAFGFELRNAATGRVYVLPSERSERAPGENGTQAVMIEVPPGTYRVTSWVTYGALAHELAGRKKLSPDDALGRPFELEAGGVVLVGSIAASETRDYPRTSWTLVPLPLTPASAAAALRDAFPGFAGAPTACLLCVPERIPGSDLRVDPLLPPGQQKIGL